MLGRLSWLPEHRGVDVCWVAGGLWYGVQRKEVKDFLASIVDGRLAKEVAQMQGGGGLDGVVCPTIILEGIVRWTDEGEMMQQYGQRWTIGQWEGLMWSLMAQGVHIISSANVQVTVRKVKGYEVWSRKRKHQALAMRPGPSNAWGTKESRDWQVHLLQGFPGIGSGTAGMILDHFGSVPLRWNVTEKEMLQVKGLGKVRVRQMMGALDEDIQAQD